MGQRELAGKRTAKRRSRTGHLGQKGIHLIEGIVLDMGCLWHPTGGNEIGIDGYIELVDPSTEEGLGLQLAVQSKALTSFRSETESGFVYWCSRSDIEYWLRSNVPVILIVSGVDSRQAYWVSVREHFRDFQATGSTRVEFDKEKNRFCRKSFSQLVDLARPLTGGQYFGALPKVESLVSNLLPVQKCPSSFFRAMTDIRSPAELWRRANDEKLRIGRDWILRDKAIMAFDDLGEPEWSSLLDPGTVEEFETEEWSESDDIDKSRQFVQLLNQTLENMLFPQVRYWRKDDCFAFAGAPEDGNKKIEYFALKRKSHLTVVTYKPYKKADKIYHNLRHLAFHGSFRRIDGQWFLEITPTYRFTTGGERLDRFHEKKLKKIKEIERNRAVLGSLFFWADYLAPNSDLFSGPKPIQFGQLTRFDIEVGIDETLWKKPDDGSLHTESTREQLQLLALLENEQ